MKIKKTDILKMIEEELEEIRVGRLADIYSQGGMGGDVEATAMDDETEESPCAAAQSEPDLESRIANIEQTLERILANMEMSETFERLKVAEEKDDNWIQDAEKDIERRGTEGVCTGKNFGSEKCPPGSKRYNLAKTFRKMAKDRKKE